MNTNYTGRSTVSQPTWDIHQSWEWNYFNGPCFDHSLPPIPPPDERWSFLDFQLNSPIGVAAGPLLNSKWIEFYAQLGYDILTYKTVRSQPWQAHPLPNIVFVAVEEIEPGQIPDVLLRGREPDDVTDTTITNSFGLPSQGPDEWRADIRQAKLCLGEGQILVVSVAGMVEKIRNSVELAEDFARCAVWAVDAGADMIEINLSCPNISAREVGLYETPDLAGLIARCVRQHIGATPLAAKLGYFPDREVMKNVVQALAPVVNALVAINSLRVRVLTEEGKQPALPGKGREFSGVCGAAIRKLGLEMVSALAALREEMDIDFKIVGCGGISKPNHVTEYLASGANALEVGTAAIWNPTLIRDIKATRRPCISTT